MILDPPPPLWSSEEEDGSDASLYKGLLRVRYRTSITSRWLRGLVRLLRRIRHPIGFLKDVLHDVSKFLAYRHAYVNERAVASRRETAESLPDGLCGAATQMEMVAIFQEGEHRTRTIFWNLLCALLATLTAALIYWMTTGFSRRFDSLPDALIATELVVGAGFMLADTSRKIDRIRASDVAYSLSWLYLLLGISLTSVGLSSTTLKDPWSLAAILLGSIQLFAVWLLVLLMVAHRTSVPRLRRELLLHHTEAYLAGRMLDALAPKGRGFFIIPSGPRVLREISDHILYEVYAAKKTGGRWVDPELRAKLWRIAAEIRSWELLKAFPNISGEESYKTEVCAAIRTLQQKKVGDLKASAVEPTPWDYIRLWLPNSVPIVLIVTIGFLSLAVQVLPESIQKDITGNFGKTSALQIIIAALAPLISAIVALSATKK